MILVEEWRLLLKTRSSRYHLREGEPASRLSADTSGGRVVASQRRPVSAIFSPGGGKSVGGRAGVLGDFENSS